MNSKVSLLTKKRVGIKNRVEEMNDKIKGIDLNVQKLLESVWGLKTREITYLDRLSHVEREIISLQTSSSKLKEGETVLHEKLFDVEELFDKLKKEFKKTSHSAEQSQLKAKQTVDEFVAKYNDINTRIVRTEVNIRQNQLLIKKLQNDIKTKATIQKNDTGSGVVESSYALKSLLDTKFESLFSQMQEMGLEQNQFNVDINEEVKNMSELINDEIIKMK